MCEKSITTEEFLRRAEIGKWKLAHLEKEFFPWRFTGRAVGDGGKNRNVSQWVAYISDRYRKNKEIAEKEFSAEMTEMICSPWLWNPHNGGGGGGEQVAGGSGGSGIVIIRNAR